jgi:hypothetical protein
VPEAPLNPLGYLGQLPPGITFPQAAYICGTSTKQIEFLVRRGVLTVRGGRIDTDSLRALIEAQRWQVRVWMRKRLL